MADIGFLADDLTGASDVLAQAHAHGLDAMLVLDPGRSMPDDADVVGIAGPARSLAGDALDAAVRSGLAALASLDLSVLLYEVCSTFDSSPTVGSIGRGIELLHERFPGHGPVPVVPAQPAFGRYTAFSQHFGAYAGEVYRLDRHPVMARHPSTPMREADLRLVLAEQLASRRPVPGLHLPAHDDGTFDDRWAQLREAADAEAFVVDAVDEAQMDTVAEALLRDPRPAGPALVVGSGGIMAALARLRGGAPRRPPAPTASRGPTLVVSASASTTTAGQIADAVRHGWVDVPIPAGDVAGDVTGKPWYRGRLGQGRQLCGLCADCPWLGSPLHTPRAFDAGSAAVRSCPPHGHRCRLSLEGACQLLAEVRPVHLASSTSPSSSASTHSRRQYRVSQRSPQAVHHGT